MKIGIAIPFYLHCDPLNKPYLTAFKYYSEIAQRKGFILHLCGSEGKLSREFSTGEHIYNSFVSYKEVPQDSFCTRSEGDDSIRKKFNDSLRTLPEDCDWFLLIGANDLVPESFFDQLEPTNKKMMAGISIQSPCYMVDTSNDNMYYRVKMKYRMPLRLLGGVNAFSKRAMENLNWRPYSFSGCETGTEMHFQKSGYIHSIDGWVIMLKGDYDLNSIDHIMRKHKAVRLEEEEVKFLNRMNG